MQPEEYLFYNGMPLYVYVPNGDVGFKKGETGKELYIEKISSYERITVKDAKILCDVIKMYREDHSEEGITKIVKKYYGMFFRGSTITAIMKLESENNRFQDKEEEQETISLASDRPTFYSCVLDLQYLYDEFLRFCSGDRYKKERSALWKYKESIDLRMEIHQSQTEYRPVIEYHFKCLYDLLKYQLLSMYMNYYSEVKSKNAAICADCGITFYPTTGKMKYCELCSKPARKQERYRRNKKLKEERK